MDQIIYLDADDDIATVRERLSSAQANQVFLVIPGRSEVFRDLVNLKVLQRHAYQFSVRVTLITSDAETRRLAREVPIPTRSRLPGGNSAPPGEPPARPNRVGLLGGGGLPAAGLTGRHASPPADTSAFSRLLGYALFLIVAAGVIGAALVLVPQATVDLLPASQVFSQSVTIRASADTRLVDVAKSQVPARFLTTSVADSMQTDTTGRRQEPSKKATGRVVITNRGGGRVTVPVGTLVRTTTGSSIRFTTVEASTVEPNSFVQVPIIAELPGSVGNVPAWAINQVEGGLAFQVSVINDTPTSGGAEQQAQLVTPADRTRLRDQLYPRLTAAAQDAVRRELRPGEILLETTIAVRVEDEAYDRELNEVTKSVGLRMRLGASAWAVPAEAIAKIMQEALESRRPAGSTVVADSVKIGGPTGVQPDGNALTFRVEGTATAIAPVDITSVRGAIQGLTVAEAERVLAKRLHLASDPAITLENGWLGRLPILGFRIQINLLR